MNDLEILLKLIEEKNKDSRRHTYIEKILLEISSNTEAFLYLYEKLSDDQKPDWKNEYKTYFKDVFFSVISLLDDERFNHYFFQGFQHLTEINLIRKEANKRLNNTKFQQFIKDFDNPKNIDQIINALMTFYGQNENRFNELLIQYKEQLKKLNKITKPNSRTLDYLYHWLTSILRNEGLNKVMEVSNMLGFDIVKCSIINNKSIRFSKDKDMLEKENFIVLEELFNKNKKIEPFQLLKSVFAFTQPLILLKEFTEIDLKWYHYFSPIIKSGILNIVKNNNEIAKLITFKEKQIGYELTDFYQILENVIDIKTFQKQTNIFWNGPANKKVDYVKEFQVWDLNIELSLHSKNKKVTKLKL